MQRKVSWDGRKDRGKTVYPPPVERGYRKNPVGHSSLAQHESLKILHRGIFLKVNAGNFTRK
jgi:hypothetical protein